MEPHTQKESPHKWEESPPIHAGKGGVHMVLTLDNHVKTVIHYHSSKELFSNEVKLLVQVHTIIVQYIGYNSRSNETEQQ